MANATTAAVVAPSADTAPVFADPDDIVVLTSRGPRLAKRHKQLLNGTIHTDAYEDACMFRAAVIRAPSLEALIAALVDLEEEQCRAVIRAAVLASADREHMRRLLRPKKGVPATLVETPRRWVALDFDDLHVPDGWWLDLPSALQQVRTHLPIEFRRASAIIQATGSAGTKNGLRVRVWFRLSRPCTSGELGRIFKGTAGLDLSTIYPANLIYTAKPVFIGMADPVPVRTMLVAGIVDEVAVQVPPETPPRSVLAPAMPILDEGWGPRPRYSQAALNHACAQIASASGGEQNTTLYRAAFSIGQLVGSGHMPVNPARAALIRAGLQMRAYSHPWQQHEIARQIDRGLAAGMDYPRVPKARGA